MRAILRNHRAVAVAVLLGACASNTEVVSSWKDPSAPPRHFNKVLAVFMSKDATLRRNAEDELAGKLEHAVPSYTVVPDSILTDRAKAKDWVLKEGYDGVVVMRPLGVDQETTYVPGQPYVVPAAYGSMWRYWGTAWGYAYSPGYVEKDQVVSMESNVYSVADGRLVWASRTKTYNPESVRQLVDEIVDETVAAMKREKVFAAREVLPSDPSS
jgi:hypothetical protein